MPTIKLTLCILALLLLLSTACVGREAVDHVPEAKQVRGQIIEVVPRNIAEIELFTVRDNSKQEYTFITEETLEFTPSHLKEHQLLGQSVLVKYVDQGGRLVAVEIGD